jgi:polar amino acid transport system substrate-binding protein
MSARHLAAACSIMGATVVFCSAVSAQDVSTTSTWQRIMATQTLRIGLDRGTPLEAFKDITNSSAPGGIQFNGETWRGIGPVLAKLLADSLGVKLDIIEASHATSIAGLQADLIDAFLPAEGTPERAKAAYFIPATVMYSAMTYYSRSSDAPTTWDALNDPKYKIGVVLDAHTDFFASAHLPKAQISRFTDAGGQIAAMQSGRVDGLVLIGSTAAVVYGRLKIGKLVTPTPIDVTANSVAIRQEMDQRWHNYLTTAINYYYTSGTIEKIFEDFLRFRDIDPTKVLPVQRELWPR